MPTAPTPIDSYGTPPNSNDPANFDARADAKVAQDVVFVGQANALAENVYDNAVEALASAISSQTSKLGADDAAAAAIAAAAAAATNAGAPVWVSGTTYAVADVRRSPADGRTYLRRTAGAGVTDPSGDPTNWQLTAPNTLQQVRVTATSATIQVNSETVFTNAAACSATAPTTPSPGNEFVARFENGRFDNTVDFGGATVMGINGQTLTGVLTFNTLGPRRFAWWADSYWRAT